jgi:hypothetical protein
MQKNTNYWSNVCAVASNNAALAINGATNCDVFTTPGIDRATLGPAAQLVPSAITVQVMNPEALQTTEGVLYGGVMNQVVQLGDDTRKWADFADEFVSFNKPRLMSAGKVCLAGVKASGIPMNMEALSHFSPIASFKSDTYTWNLDPPSGQLLLDCDLTGFAPIVFVNPSQIKLQYLVTTEYRLRFDISHPAASTHTHHNPGSIQTWSNVVKTLCDLGDGVRDIADVVASTGRAYQASSAALALRGA